MPSTEDELWCPECHEARDPIPAGPSSALCACGVRFSTRPGVHAAYRAESGVDSALPVAAQPSRPTPTAPEFDPSADGPLSPTREARGWSEAEINAPAQLPEGNEPEADPEPRPGAAPAPVVEPRPPRPRDILDWLARGPDA